MTHTISILTCSAAWALLANVCIANEPREAQVNSKESKVTSRPLTLEEIFTPYSGPIVKPEDNTTIRKKVMAGYQGWFMAEGDGYDRGFTHWGPLRGTPPRCSVDFWPDLTEFDDDERFDTNYRHRDGSVAKVFSSTNKKTVVRHFRWMKEYGIDGVFVQRFTSCVSNQTNWNYRRSCAVLNNCREGANRYGRVYAVMYDTNFDRKSVDAMKADWTRLVKQMKLTTTPAYMQHEGAPVVSLWGYGFGHRKFDAKATEELFKFFKNPENGGCTIMLGVPNDWASWTGEKMRVLKTYATVISPWNVGRYGNVDGAKKHFKAHWPKDIAFCKANRKDYYPVVFPGFSWTNLKKGAAKLNHIPRRKGSFLWGQIEQVREYGMDMIYVAMFDEVDEGTAIFKCTNEPPVGRFATYEGLPSDYYLKLCGQARAYLRGADVTLPVAKPDPKQMTYRPMSQLEYYADPSRFDAETVKGWRKGFDGVSVYLHEGPYSQWAQDLIDAKPMQINVSSWKDVLEKTDTQRLMIVVSGNEGLAGVGMRPKEIADGIAAHLKGGGVLLVLSAGRYPMYYPDKGALAKTFGFSLHIDAAPKGSVVNFSETLGGKLEKWPLPGSLQARLMRKDDHAGAKEYHSLASVRTPDGKAIGDAIAFVRPKGQLGNGAIIYVASDLLKYPKRADILGVILELTRSALNAKPLKK